MSRSGRGRSVLSAGCTVGACAAPAAAASALGIAFLLAALTSLVWFAAYQARVNQALQQQQAESQEALKKTREMSAKLLDNKLLAEGHDFAGTLREKMRQTRVDALETVTFPAIQGIVRCWDNQGRDPL